MKGPNRLADDARVATSIEDLLPILEARPDPEFSTGLDRSWLGGGTLDSRNIDTGVLFFAFAGEKTDGHRFVGEALKGGAVAAVVEERAWCRMTGEEKRLACGDEVWGPVLMVSNVTRALQELARWHRDRWDTRVIGITGTSGKTTTKEFVSRVLAEKGRTASTKGNLNNHLGVPLTLLALRPTDELAVVEMGASDRGDIRLLAELARPEIGILTSVGPAHLEFFGTIEDVLAAKWELAEGLQRQGALIVNGDDPRLAARAARWKGPLVTYGFTAGVDLQAQDAHVVEKDRHPPGAGMKIEGKEIHLQQLGRGALYAALAAFSVARIEGIDTARVVEAMEELPPLPGRLRPLSAGDTILIDDTYNASPASVENALEVIKEWPCRGRRIVVLGDMLELGGVSGEAHHKMGGAVVAAGVDLLFLWGEWATHTRQGALAAGMQASAIHHASDRDELSQSLSRSMAPGDVVLLKSSRRGRLEEVAATLMQRKS